jgi:hypothetical protein
MGSPEPKNPSPSDASRVRLGSDEDFEQDFGSTPTVLAVPVRPRYPVVEDGGIWTVTTASGYVLGRYSTRREADRAARSLTRSDRRWYKALATLGTIVMLAVVANFVGAAAWAGTNPCLRGHTEYPIGMHDPRTEDGGPAWVCDWYEKDPDTNPWLPENYLGALKDRVT